MIEPVWLWVKRRTTKEGATANKKAAENGCLDTWKDLHQKQTQQWIERIPRAIQQVIEEEGGNECVKSRFDEQARKEERARQQHIRRKEQQEQRTRRATNITAVASVEEEEEEEEENFNNEEQ